MQTYQSGEPNSLPRADSVTPAAASMPVVDISVAQLVPGKLESAFAAGALAVVLRDDARVERVWAAVSHAPSYVSVDTALIEMARSHKKGNNTVGGMLRFIPGRISHIASKIKMQSDAQVSTRSVDATQGAVDLDATQSDEVRGLMAQVFQSALPANVDLPRHAVTVERLTYPVQSDLDAVYALLHDSGGGWVALGHRMEQYKSQARGLFNMRIMRDLFALTCAVPGLRALTRRCNDAMNWNTTEAPDGYRIIGTAHVDQTKYLTALMSDRDALATQVYDGQDWHDLHLDTRSLAIFPSAKLARFSGIQPTIHRVLMNENVVLPRAANVTVSLAIAD